MIKCTNCGGGKFTAGTFEQRRTIGERSFKANVPGRQCDQCDQVVLPLPALVAFEQAVAQKLVEMAASDGEAFRAVRKAAGLPSKDLAALVGVSPETVSRWENGRRPIDRGVWFIAASLLDDAVKGITVTRERLLAMQHPRKARGAVTVEPKILAE